uniref:Uncharacterized protein n=1 Tax=Macaca mulatta TaxID=9544 RepID=A0A5F7Z843_MACMU
LAGITGTRYHAGLIFVFLVETGFHHIGQAGLRLLTSGDLPASASQGPGIIGVSHRTCRDALSSCYPRDHTGLSLSCLQCSHLYSIPLAFVSSFTFSDPHSAPWIHFSK